jgi:hypothetical protein
MPEIISQIANVGLITLGIVFAAFFITFITITGVMVLFLIYRQVFFPKQKKSESLQYTLFKQFVFPFLNSAINDVTKAASTKLKEQEKRRN